MSRVLAAIWLVLVALLGVNLAWRVHQGLVFRTDLMALLPRDEANPALQRVNDSVAQSISRRVAILVGQRDRGHARQSAAMMANALAESSLVEIDSSPAELNRFAGLGALYFPYREGLLSEHDRQALLAGHAEALSTRALSQVFGIAGLADARLLRRDPFMLLPAFLTALPVPSSRLSIDGGMLSVTDAGITWILISGHLRGDPYALDIQARLNAMFEAATHALQADDPDVQILHAGAVFFAGASARTTLADMSMLGTVSSVGTIALVLLVFRAMTPLLLSLLAIGVGMGAGLSVSLLLFGDLHILAMLLGLSLIGIAVDYSLYYCVEVFAPGQRSSRQRLARVMPGITLGLVTTAVGYATFLLAPFPGLRQVAAFSVVGLIASFVTVVLWLPLLDRRGPARHGGWLLAAMTLLWRFWESPRLRAARIVVLTAMACIGIVGAWRFSTLDDVRRMQSLAPDLVAEQTRMQQIAGFDVGTQFFVVRAADDETTLRRTETLLDRLRPLRLAGALRNYRAPASFVPSAERQRQNRELRQDRLETPLLASYLAQIGLPAVEQEAGPDGVLTLAIAEKPGPLAQILSELTVPDAGDVAHIVMLDGVSGTDAVRAAGRGIDGVNFVDPAADFSRLLGRYRRRTVILIAVSAVLMLPLLALRYGMWGAARVMLPAVATVVLVPLAKAICGDPFTFFDAIALVLVLSIAVDYAVFCAEADAAYKPVALLGVGMAMVSTALSFGLLYRSQVAAVHAVGSTMLLGVVPAFLLAPMAGTRRGGGQVAEAPAIRNVANSVSAPVSSRTMASMQLLGVIASAGLGLAGCAPAGAPPSGLSNGQVTVAPGIAFSLPPPATLGRSVEAQQLVTARYRDETFVFETRISVTPARLLVVGTDMLGRRAMTIEWTGDDLKVEAAPWMPAELRARNVIADIMLLHWPENAVRAGVAPEATMRATGLGHRVFAVAGRDMIRIDRTDGVPGRWSGRWTYRNLGWGYDLDIQSIEATP